MVKKGNWEMIFGGNFDEIVLEISSLQYFIHFFFFIIIGVTYLHGGRQYMYEEELAPLDIRVCENAERKQKNHLIIILANGEKTGEMTIATKFTRRKHIQYGIK